MTRNMLLGVTAVAALSVVLGLVAWVSSSVALGLAVMLAVVGVGSILVVLVVLTGWSPGLLVLSGAAIVVALAGVIAFGTNVAQRAWSAWFVAPHGIHCQPVSRAKYSPVKQSAPRVNLTPLVTQLVWHFGQERDCRLLTVSFKTSIPIRPKRIRVYATPMIRTDQAAQLPNPIRLTRVKGRLGRRTFVFSVKVDPNSAPAGEYQGSLHIGGRNVSAVSIPIMVTQKDRAWKALLPAILAALAGVFVKSLHDHKLLQTTNGRVRESTVRDLFNYLLSTSTIVSALIGVITALLALVGLYSNNPTFGSDYGGKDLITVLTAAFAAVGAQAVLQGAGSAATTRRKKGTGATRTARAR